MNSVIIFEFDSNTRRYNVVAILFIFESR